MTLAAATDIRLSVEADNCIADLQQFAHLSAAESNCTQVNKLLASNAAHDAYNAVAWIPVSSYQMQLKEERYVFAFMSKGNIVKI